MFFLAHRTCACLSFWPDLATFRPWQLYTAAVAYIYIYICIYDITSSTGQGGGGSFKNRKPIGELGCCESGMAERIH